MEISDRALLELPPIRRMYGTEIEYSLVSRFDTDYNSPLFNILPGGLKRINSYLSNGGRYYPDCGHPEYATPECDSIGDAVIHELAGEKVLLNMVGMMQKEDPNMRLHKRNVDKDVPEPHYWGSHMNLLTERDRIDFNGKKFRNAWMAHLVTQAVYTGSGTLHNGKFRVAQKLTSVSVLDNHLANHSSARPIIDTKDEPLADKNRWRRIQVSCGDANVSPWAMRMKLGTTGLVLRMLEYGVDLSDLSLRRPLTAAYTTARDYTLKQKIAFESAPAARPLDVQRQFARRAQKLGKLIVLPDEEYEVINEWLKVVDDLDTDTKQTGNRIDWVAKKAILDIKRARLGSNWHHPELERHDLLYDLLGSKQSIGERLRAKGLLIGMPDDKRIERAITVPPPTRAHLRGKFILDASQRPRQIKDLDVNWSQLAYGSGRQRRNITLEDPYQNSVQEVEVNEFLRAFKKYSQT